MENKLILTSLEKAVASLQDALNEYAKEEDLYVRDAVIQRFEYTYELSHKLLKRHLEATAANPDEIDTLSFQDLIRLGSERQLLRSGWEKWSLYRKLRGTTSHTYDEAKAQEAMKKIPEFYEEAHFLLQQLQEHHG
jgi:nucleotidyltransferase substrate binding protein (TIGR01987 family)